ncbi:copper resistance protein CopC [Gemmatimonas sp.]|uniref:copper resistance protein CopC n=1 Tax=Gemmatimonas sp. TaxID=1962908 RepID=UPI0037BEF154
MIPLAARTVPLVPAVALGVALCAAWPGPAGASRLPHLKLKRSFPAKDTVLTSSPDAVRLWLTERSELPATKITVTTDAKAPVATEKVTRAAGADAPIEAKFTTPLAAGRYTVTWRTMSKDGHVVNGTFGFTVKSAP